MPPCPTIPSTTPTVSDTHEFVRRHQKNRRMRCSTADRALGIGTRLPPFIRPPLGLAFWPFAEILTADFTDARDGILRSSSVCPTERASRFAVWCIGREHRRRIRDAEKVQRSASPWATSASCVRDSGRILLSAQTRRRIYRRCCRPTRATTTNVGGGESPYCAVNRTTPAALIVTHSVASGRVALGSYRIPARLVNALKQACVHFRPIQAEARMISWTIPCGALCRTVSFVPSVISHVFDAMGLGDQSLRDDHCPTGGQR